MARRNRVHAFWQLDMFFSPFSRQIIEVMDESGVAYDAFNILEDEEVRQGLKKFSDWPTYPQLYVKGELIGGLDIVRELSESDELMDILNQ